MGRALFHFRAVLTSHLPWIGGAAGGLCDGSGTGIRQQRLAVSGKKEALRWARAVCNKRLNSGQMALGRLLGGFGWFG
jgi:hypothetical protein